MEPASIPSFTQQPPQGSADRKLEDNQANTNDPLDKVILAARRDMVYRPRR